MVCWEESLDLRDHSPVAAVSAFVAASMVTATALVAGAAAPYACEEENQPNEVICGPRVGAHQGERWDVVDDEPC